MSSVEVRSGSGALPGSQVLHSRAPSLSWYVPALHLRQSAWLTLGLNVPGAQSTGLIEPTGQYVPAPHVTHSSTLVIMRMEELEWLPAGQAIGAAAPG